MAHFIYNIANLMLIHHNGSNFKKKKDTAKLLCVVSLKTTEAPFRNRAEAGGSLTMKGAVDNIAVENWVQMIK